MAHTRIGDIYEAKNLILQHHYSKRVPSNVQVVVTWHADGGLFGDYGHAIAACVFSIPPTRWKHRVLELSRLVRAPECEVPLTGLISLASKQCKRNGWHLLVSFADPTAGHHGGIYQAASWRYHAQRGSRMDGVMMAGRFIPGRSCNSTFGTQSLTKLAALFPGVEMVPHYDKGKHLYWRSLSKQGDAMARDLELADMPYPKPQLS